LVLQQFEHQGVGQHVGLVGAGTHPLAANERTLRMVVEQHVPQELVAVAEKAVGDHLHAAAQLHRRQLGRLDVERPAREPLARGRGVVDGVVQHRHQVRLTGATLADHHHRAGLARADGLDGPEQIVCGVGDAQEPAGGNLGGSGLVLVGEFDGRALEQLALKLFAQR
jgi:hypothetical protein